MSQDDVEAGFYARHLQEMQRRAEAALLRGGFDALLISSGVERRGFLDDKPYPFQVNPHFKAWVPLTSHPYSWLVVRPQARPRVVVYQPNDYWHAPPAEPAGAWTAHVDLTVVHSLDDVASQIRVPGRLAILGEADTAALPGRTPNNPTEILDVLHYARARKTEYELQQMRSATQRAVPAHRAALAAFGAGASESEIHQAYLAACGHSDLDLPYPNIVALNGHAAILHYQQRRRSFRLSSPRSLLIDAGAEESGYGCDITRTWSDGDVYFDALATGLEQAQLALVDEVRPGAEFVDIHLDAHRKVARLLVDSGLVRWMSVEALVLEGVTSIFFPHGVGHLLGLQVHDVGGHMADDMGGVRAPPNGHPQLRLTRRMEPDMVVTIEPGIYFIPQLLEQLHSRPHASAVDWPLVKHLSRFGGVRVEDNVVCRGFGPPENLTRDAFGPAC